MRLEVLVIPDIGFPEDGLDSPSAVSMHRDTLDKADNCQIGKPARDHRLGIDHDRLRLFMPTGWPLQHHRRPRTRGRDPSPVVTIKNPLPGATPGGHGSSTLATPDLSGREPLTPRGRTNQ